MGQQLLQKTWATLKINKNYLNPLLHNKILALVELKVFEDNKLNGTKNIKFVE